MKFNVSSHICSYRCRSITHNCTIHPTIHLSTGTYSHSRKLQNHSTSVIDLCHKPGFVQSELLSSTRPVIFVDLLSTTKVYLTLLQRLSCTVIFLFSYLCFENGIGCVVMVTLFLLRLMHYRNSVLKVYLFHQSFLVVFESNDMFHHDYKDVYVQRISPRFTSTHFLLGFSPLRSGHYA